MSDHDRTILDQQLDGAASTLADIYAVIDRGSTYYGSGWPQDPHEALATEVMEVLHLSAVRLVLSTGGPRVVAQALIERDGSVSSCQLVASSPWDDVVRPIHPESPVGRLLQQHAEVVGVR